MKYFITVPVHLADMLSFALFITGLIVREMYGQLTLSRHILTFSLLLMYLKYLEVFSIHKQLGVKVIMIKNMVNNRILYLKLRLLW